MAKRRRPMNPMDRPPDPDPRDILSLNEGGPLWRALRESLDQQASNLLEGGLVGFLAAADQTRVAIMVLPWPKTKLLWVTPRVAREWGQMLVSVADQADQGVPRTQADADEIRRAVQAAFLLLEEP